MIYVLGMAVMILQAICAAHAYQAGRQNWIFYIIVGGPLGVCAYFAFVIMPEIYAPRAAKAHSKTIRSPALQLKLAEAALAEVETAANHSAVADAMLAMRAYAGAASHYRSALDCLRGPDKRIEMRLAEALFESGEATEALAIVERQTASPAIGEEDRRTMLKARILEHLDRDAEALDLYRDIATRLPGAEARCRFAALLIKQGRPDEARPLLHGVIKDSKRPGVAPSAEDAAMHEWARTALADTPS